MGVGISGDFHFRVAETASDFLDVDAFVDKKGSMGMTEIVDSDFPKICKFCKVTVFVVEAGIT